MCGCSPPLQVPVWILLLPGKCATRYFLPLKQTIWFKSHQVSAVIVLAFILTSIDKLLHSECGFSCGYSLTHPMKWLNPIDTFLVVMAKVLPCSPRFPHLISTHLQWFPLDYIILGLIVTYFYFATLDGIIHIGIRFLWMLVCTLKHNTPLLLLPNLPLRPVLTKFL